MRDDDDRGAFGLELQQRAHQLALTFLVEAGVRFVEDEQAWPAVDCTRQRDALPLPAGERLAALADQRVEAVFERLYPVRETGARERVLDPGRVRVAETGDVLGQRSGEDLDVLRQVADVRAELALVPLRDVGTVEPDTTALRRPQADQEAGERRLAAGRRPDDAEDGPRIQREADVTQQDHVRPRRRRRHGLDGKLAGRRWQRHSRLRLGQRRQQIVEPGVRLTRSADRLPRTNELSERGDRPTGDDRGDDEQRLAAGEGPDQRQPDAEPDHQRALQELEELVRRHRSGNLPRSVCLQLQVLALDRHPAVVQLRAHSHRAHHLGVVQRGGRVRLRADGLLARLAECGAGAALGHPGQQQLDGSDHGCRIAEDRIDQEDDDEEEQRSWRIEDGQHRRSRDELAQGAEVAEDGRPADTQLAQVGLEDCGEEAPGELAVEHLAGSRQHFPTHPLEGLHQRIAAEHEQRQHQQRFLTAAVHHPVIDLEHVDGGRQDQQVDADAEQQGSPGERRQRGQRTREFAGRRD